MASGESLVPISAFFSPRLVTDFGILYKRPVAV